MNQIQVLSPTQLPLFYPYEDLDAETAELARAAAQRIRPHLSRQIEAIVAVGRELIAIKPKLGHGQYLDWVRMEFGMKPRTAQNYTSVAEWLGAKYANFAHLNLTTVYVLAAKSTPEPLRIEVLSAIENGEPLTDDDIKQRIDDAKEQAERERQQAEREKKRAAWAQKKAAGKFTNADAADERRAKREEKAEREAEQEQLAKEQRRRARFDAAKLAAKRIADWLSDNERGELRGLLDDVEYYQFVKSLQDALKPPMIIDATAIERVALAEAAPAPAEWNPVSAWLGNEVAA